jgi:hypothetical protein
MTHKISQSSAWLILIQSAYPVSYPFLIGEEIPMTFQIGMVATNGVLLASDRKMTNVSGFRYGWQVPKIKVYEDFGFAHQSAGDALCNTFTSELYKEIRKGKTQFAGGKYWEVEPVLTQCVETAWSKEATNRAENSVGRMPMPKCVGGATMVVFWGIGTVALWVVSTQEASPGIEFIDVGSGRVTGHPNLAGFFHERYFPELPNKVDALLPLAVHSVRMAECDLVGGLQVATFTKDGPKIFTAKELKPYDKLSRELNREILKRLKGS